MPTQVHDDVSTLMPSRKRLSDPGRSLALASTMPSDTPRYIPLTSLPPPPSLTSDSLPALKQTLGTCLAETLASVNQHAKEYRRSAIYTGLAGISLLNARLSSSSAALTALHCGQDELNALAITQLNEALASDPLRMPSSGSKVAFLDTSVGPATLVVLYQFRAYESHPSSLPFSDELCFRAIRLLTSAVDIALQPSSPPEDGCELLYGRAGLLYALALLRSALSNSSLDTGTTAREEFKVPLEPLISDETIRLLVGDIISRGQAGAVHFSRELEHDELHPALMWSWHGKRYIGGAHGIAGILEIILHIPSQTVAPHVHLIVQTLTYLLSLQDRHGNWPSKAVPHRRRPHASDNDLVQWCHGAPGIIPLISTALMSRTIPVSSPLQTSLLSALTRGAALVHSRGLLLKGGGLCHGVGGTAASLFRAADSLASHPEEQRECVSGAFHLLQCYAERGDGGEFRTSDRPWSLYEGAAGVCAALAEGLERIDAMLEGSQESNGEGNHNGGLLASYDLHYHSMT